MSKLAIKEILDIPQLSFYLEPHEFSFFTTKVKDFETLANIYNSEKVDAVLNMSGSIYSEYDGLENANINANFITERLNSIPDTRDSQITSTYANAMKSVLTLNSKLVNKDSLILFLGGLASKYLKDISTPNKFTEIVYTNGDIINVKNGNAIKKDVTIGTQKIQVEEIKKSLAEGILIAFKELQENLKRNRNFSIRGTYLGRGLNASPEKMSFSLDELESTSRSRLLFESLGIEKIKELHNKKLITNSDLIKAASNNQISKADVLLLYKEGLLRKDDILKRVFKQKDFRSILGKKEENLKILKNEYRKGITIDPQMRLAYLESIGSVKRVKVNGQMWITEDEKSRKKTNSLDGYEILIIPDKKIAILEKFYEVTRDLKGNMQYKKNEKGEYIPAISNATYIMPIGLAKDLIENKNKKDLIESRYVHRTFHTADWVRANEKKMLRINPEIQFEKTNTDIWAKKISENYKKNKDIRSL